ncbi:MAG TPA: hypothetical protein VK183_05235 [Flavobacterium sp.]|nr:hypothetical protein [Flavobacterium sp.]
MYATTTSCSVALAIIVLLVFVLRRHLSALLKDESTLPVPLRSYSLSRSILFFWTMVLFLSICYIGIKTDNLTPIDSGVLILMGIVVGTATTGRVIDSSQTQDPAIIRTQDTHQSQGFLLDILSDGNGVSISRLQTVIFNIIYGCAFVSLVITQEILYNFPTETLTLLGISSGAYAFMKVPENKPTPPPPPVNQLQL